MIKYVKLVNGLQKGILEYQINYSQINTIFDTQLVYTKNMEYNKVKL